MKYIITENRLNEYVLDFLNKEFRNLKSEEYDNDYLIFGEDGNLLFEIVETEDDKYKLRISINMNRIEIEGKLDRGWVIELMSNGHSTYDIATSYELSEETILECTDLLDKEVLIQGLSFSEDFINKSIEKEYFNLDDITNFSMKTYSNLSSEFISKYKEYISWNRMILYISTQSDSFDEYVDMKPWSKLDPYNCNLFPCVVKDNFNHDNKARFYVINNAVVGKLYANDGSRFWTISSHKQIDTETILKASVLAKKLDKNFGFIRRKI